MDPLWALGQYNTTVLAKIASATPTNVVRLIFTRFRAIGPSLQIQPDAPRTRNRERPGGRAPSTARYTPDFNFATRDTASLPVPGLPQHEP
jgi:hypothetical protein